MDVFVECPICSLQFKNTLIEQHVEKCIELASNKVSTRHGGVKTSLSAPRKRVRVDESSVSPNNSSKKSKVQKEISDMFKKQKVSPVMMENSSNTTRCWERNDIENSRVDDAENCSDDDVPLCDLSFSKDKLENVGVSTASLIDYRDNALPGNSLQTLEVKSDSENSNKSLFLSEEAGSLLLASIGDQNICNRKGSNQAQNSSDDKSRVYTGKVEQTKGATNTCLRSQLLTFSNISGEGASNKGRHKSKSDIQAKSMSYNDSNNMKNSTASVNFAKDSKKEADPLNLISKLGKTPLAELLRPHTLTNYVGQSKVVGKETLFEKLILQHKIPSTILWGPPGCGKTTLANIISQLCKERDSKHRFVTLSATTAGINDVKDAVKVAKNESRLSGRKTVLFIDEVHRFNKLQQDSFLPHVENGTIILIGATTENPSFTVTNALLSRCRVVVLEKLAVSDVETILTNAVRELGGIEEGIIACDKVETFHPIFSLENGSIRTLANLCDGDARSALNCLDFTLQSYIPSGLSSSPEDTISIKYSSFIDALQRTHIKYDKKGDEHYNMISAMHKSIRGSDDNASLYWLARMYEGGEDPLYIARRLVRIASEDIGLADPNALNQAVAAYQACHSIGKPECDVILAQAAVYLSRAPKSVEVYEALDRARSVIQDNQGSQPSVPLHIRNAPTKLMKDMGCNKNYIYTPHHPDVKQDFLPPELLGTNFFKS